VYSSLGLWLNRADSRYTLDYRPDSHYHFGRMENFEDLLRVWLAGNRSMNCGDLSRFYTLALNVDQALRERIPGDFVELGVYKGNSAGVLAAFAREHARQVFLFDTFGGFDERDLRGVDGGRNVQFEDTSLAAVQRLVGTRNVTYVQGFFPESARQTQLPDTIAVAHLDCDLYQPTRAGLECFYPRLSPGGIILVHDYSSGHWPGVTQAVDEFCEGKPEWPVLIPDKSGTAIIRKAA
jgi:hypothetical protein